MNLQASERRHNLNRIEQFLVTSGIGFIRTVRTRFPQGHLDGAPATLRLNAILWSL